MGFLRNLVWEKRTKELLIDKVIPVVEQKRVQKVGDGRRKKRGHTEREGVESPTVVGHTWVNARLSGVGAMKEKGS